MTFVLPMSTRYPAADRTGQSQSDLNDAARDKIASSIFPMAGLDVDAVCVTIRIK
jgi:hypothetical protein